MLRRVRAPRGGKKYPKSYCENTKNLATWDLPFFFEVLKISRLKILFYSYRHLFSHKTVELGEEGTSNIVKETPRLGAKVSILGP